MRDREIDALLVALRRAQAEENMNLTGLARRLGVTAACLSMVFAGKRRPGLRLLRAAVERYPEVRRLLAESLQTLEDDQDPKGLREASSR